MGLRCGGWVGGLSVIGGRRCCQTVAVTSAAVRDVSFGGRLYIRDEHAMRNVPPVLMQMHDA